MNSEPIDIDDFLDEKDADDVRQLFWIVGVQSSLYVLEEYCSSSKFKFFWLVGTLVCVKPSDFVEKLGLQNDLQTNIIDEGKCKPVKISKLFFW
jgi:hypothetical protein